jgi:hypothetical protein
VDPSTLGAIAEEGRAFSVISLAERALSPLDAARGAVLRSVAGIQPLREVIANRNIRVPIGLTVHALIAFVIALLVPSLSLVVAPIVLGVPHVVSDIRYLVLRRNLPRSWLWAIAVFGGALFVFRFVPVLDPLTPDRLVVEHAVASSWVLLGALLGGRSAGLRKRSALAIAVALLIAGLSLAEPHLFRLVLAHAHNLMAIVIWLMLFRSAPAPPAAALEPKAGARSWPTRQARSLGLALLPVVLVLLGGAWLASGTLLEFTMRHGVLSFLGLHLFFAADWLAPGVRDPQAVGLTSAFAFLQSVHYGIWLWAIPQDEAKTQRTTTFRMTWRALRRDLRPLGVQATLAVVSFVLIAGVMAPIRTQMLVLSLGGFHAWLELAVLAFLLARGDISSRSCAGVSA